MTQQQQAYPTPLLKDARRRSQNTFSDTYQYRQLLDSIKSNLIVTASTNSAALLEKGW